MSPRINAHKPVWFRAAGESGLRAYLSEVVLLPESSLVGKTLSAAALGEDLDLVVVRILRDKTVYLAPRGGSDKVRTLALSRLAPA